MGRERGASATIADHSPLALLTTMTEDSLRSWQYLPRRHGLRARFLRQEAAGNTSLRAVTATNDAEQRPIMDLFALAKQRKTGSRLPRLDIIHSFSARTTPLYSPFTDWASIGNGSCRFPAPIDIECTIGGRRYSQLNTCPEYMEKDSTKIEPVHSAHRY